MDGGWDSLMAALKKDKVWGNLSIVLKDGEPATINLNRGFKNVEDAVAAVTRDIVPHP